MIRRTRTAKDYKEPDISDLSFTQTESGAEDSDEWCPSELKVPKKKARAEPGLKKPPVKRAAKPKPLKEPKPRAPPKPKASKAPPGPRAPRGPKAPPGPKPTEIQKELNQPEAENHGGTRHTDSPLESRQARQVKEERLSFALPAGPSWEPSAGAERASSSRQSLGLKKEEPPEDFTFDEPSLKRQKTEGAPQGRPTRQPYSGRGLEEEFNMNWDPVELLSERSGVEPWVCVNVARLLNEENTVPFMVRYRKDLINHLDADAVRNIQLNLEEIRALAKKTQSISQSLKKEGLLTAGLETALRNCRAAEELDHVYAPYKKDSGLTKARRARELGLEPAALELLSTPHSLDLHCWVRPSTKGLSTVEEVATGVQQILADMIAKDGETLKFIRSLCDNSVLMLQSSVSKTALKEQQALGVQGRGGGQGRGRGQAQGRGREQGMAPGQQSGPKGKPKDIDNFHLYHDFSCNIRSIQHHQTLAINRGENLKILTVKVNISDRVRSNFCHWCLSVRWKPKTVARPELLKILQDAVEDSYKRLLLPLLTRSYRSKLTAGAEKESIAMFVRNLRQRLLVCPVRGRVLLGVDPGFRHGCKLAVLSPTSQILHTDVVYLHTPDHHREAQKLHSLLLKYSCSMVVIGNGTACRETEAFFADLISRRFFHPLDVSYCITNEAGASIYSVSAEAVKEMPDLDPNLRSAVSIGRRVQDPLAELVKIDPKHIGIGTYQHDVSAGALKAALDGVVQECVSFVGVDVNICSETLMRHVSGLNAGQARNIVEWREKNGPFQNREQLRLVKGVGPKSYQQCAGFIRINPHSLHSEAPGGAAAAPQEPSKKAAKKTKSSASAQPNPLDQTCIHPESYSIATSFLSLVGGGVDELGQPELRQKVEARVRAEGLERLASSLGCSPDTLQLIVDGLTQPPGFDIRQNFEQPDFKRGIVSMADLRAGTVLTGRVENAALFGVFVDIGVGRSGLIHKSKITPDKLPSDSQQRSLTLGPGERVEVRVLSLDAQRGRIGLDLIRVLR